jgi:hypothetical protein
MAGVAARVGRSREARRTIDAHPRGLAEYLEMRELAGVDPLTAIRAGIGVLVRELTERPSRRGREHRADRLRGRAPLRLPGTNGELLTHPGYRSHPPGSAARRRLPRQHGHPAAVAHHPGLTSGPRTPIQNWQIWPLTPD